MAFRRSSASRNLSSGPLVLTSARRSGRLVVFSLLLVAFVAAVVLGMKYYEFDFAFGQAERTAVPEHEETAVPDLVVRLEDENRELQVRLANLTESLERAQLDLQIAAVTQEELERQIVVLNEHLRQVKEELEFVKSAEDTR